MKTHLAKSNKGFSIIEGLVASGIVAVSILAIGMIVGRHGEFSKKTMAKQELPGVGTDVINRVRSVILDIKDPNSSLNNQGICKILSPHVVLPGVTPIDLDLTKEIANSTKWSTAFSPEWTLSGYKRSGATIAEFKLVPVSDKNSLIDVSGIDKNSVYVEVKVTTRKIDPYGNTGDLFAIVRDSKVDSKTAIFLIETKAYYEIVNANGQKQKRDIAAQDILSILDIGSCHVTDATGRRLTLSPSGTGAGDPRGETIYNDTSYITPSDSIFTMSLLKREVTQGERPENNPRTLRARSADNVVAACTEQTYRCPKNNGTRSFRPFINLRANVTFHSVNKVTSARLESVRVRPEIQLLDSSGVDQIARRGLKVDYAGGPNTNYAPKADKLYYVMPENGQIETSNNPLRIGGSEASVMATIQNAEPFCRDVCDMNQLKTYTPALMLSTPDLRAASSGAWDSQTQMADMPLHCTMCFTKACGRMGLETFGPAREMPSEPLDSQVPECASEDTTEATKVFPYANMTVSGLDDTDKCISAKVSGDKLVFRARSCTDSIPAMCFAYGQYTLARTLENSRAPHSMTFAQAQDACRDLGRERQSVADLAAGFSQQGRNPSSLNQIPREGSDYSFQNLAKAGTFFAPQSVSEMKDAVDVITHPDVRYIGFDHARNGGEFWVGLRAEDGFVIADVPLASTTNGANRQHAVYYDGAGTITHDVVTADISSIVKGPSGGADTAYMLINHVKFRGVVPASKNQINAAAFLCRKNGSGSFFVSRLGSTDFSRGGDYCESEDGLFVTPTAPTSWAKALLSVQPNLSYAPFPNINNDPVRVWVALQGSDKDPALQGKLSRLGNKNPVDGSDVVEDGAVFGTGFLVKRNGNTYSYQDVPGSNPPTKAWMPDPAVKYKVACLEAVNGDIVLRNEAQGCQIGERRLSKGDLQKKIISRLWVQAEQRGRLALGYKEFIKVGP